MPPSLDGVDRLPLTLDRHLPPRGLPSGADLEYSDDTTLAHALEARSEFPPASTTSGAED